MAGFLDYDREGPRLVQRYEWPSLRNQDEQPFAIKPDVFYDDPALFWLQTQLARFTYKPGWHAWIERTQGDYTADYRLTVGFLGEDTYNPSRQIPLRSIHAVPLILGEAGRLRPEIVETAEAHFAHWLASCLLETERHEQREWLRRDGQIVDDPHARERARG